MNLKDTTDFLAWSIERLNTTSVELNNESFTDPVGPFVTKNGFVKGHPDVPGVVVLRAASSRIDDALTELNEALVLLKGEKEL